MPLPSKDTDPVGHYAYKLGEAEQEIKQMRAALMALHACIDFDQAWDPPHACCVEDTEKMNRAVEQARPIVRRLLQQQ